MGDDDASVVTTGRCMCGDIRFEYRGAPIETGHCHCESCRRHTSAPFVTYVVIDKSTNVWGFRLAARLRLPLPDDPAILAKRSVKVAALAHSQTCVPLPTTPHAP